MGQAFGEAGPPFDIAVSNVVLIVKVSQVRQVSFVQPVLIRFGRPIAQEHPATQRPQRMHAAQPIALEWAAVGRGQGLPIDRSDRFIGQLPDQPGDFQRGDVKPMPETIEVTAAPRPGARGGQGGHFVFKPIV